jgi:disulfide bond formation protein DsbB
MLKLWHSLSSRWLYLAGTLAISGLLGFALFLQKILHEDPCPLCMVQRYIFLFMGILFLLATLHNPKRLGVRIYSGLITLFSLFGIGVAVRHIWIQHLPANEVPACGPGLDYMLDNFPMADVLKELLHGSGECAAKGWSFLGLNIPEWSLIWFTLLGIWALMIAFRKKPA